MTDPEAVFVLWPNAGFNNILDLSGCNWDSAMHYEPIPFDISNAFLSGLK
jgi:hypothetical protein